MKQSLVFLNDRQAAQAENADMLLHVGVLIKARLEQQLLALGTQQMLDILHNIRK